GVNSTSHLAIDLKRIQHVSLRHNQFLRDGLGTLGPTNDKLITGRFDPQAGGTGACQQRQAFHIASSSKGSEVPPSNSEMARSLGLVEKSSLKLVASSGIETRVSLPSVKGVTALQSARSLGRGSAERLGSVSPGA